MFDVPINRVTFTWGPVSDIQNVLFKLIIKLNTCLLFILFCLASLAFDVSYSCTSVLLILFGSSSLDNYNLTIALRDAIKIVFPFLSGPCPEAYRVPEIQLR